ncbi:MAG TPA: hypothetical protein VFC58_12470 [Desulfosporosinus sp.]|nr:hypothetical protein [Desulfosporosinus sp.]
MISEKFTIDDIHLIRYENYEKTKDMKQEELIEKTRRDAEEGKRLLEKLRNKIQKKVSIKNI